MTHTITRHDVGAVHMWEGSVTLTGSLDDESAVFGTYDEARRFVMRAARRQRALMRGRRIGDYVTGYGADGDMSAIVESAHVSWDLYAADDADAHIGYALVAPARSTAVEFADRAPTADPTDCTVCPEFATYGDEAPAYATTVVPAGVNGADVPACLDCRDSFFWQRAADNGDVSDDGDDVPDNAVLVLDHGYVPLPGARCRVTFDMTTGTADEFDEYTSSSAPVVIRRTYPATIASVAADGAVTVRNGHTVHPTRVHTTLHVDCPDCDVVHPGTLFGRTCSTCRGAGVRALVDMRPPVADVTPVPAAAALVRAVPARHDGARFVSTGAPSFVFDTYRAEYVPTGALVPAIDDAPDAVVYPCGNGYIVIVDGAEPFTSDDDDTGPWLCWALVAARRVARERNGAPTSPSYRSTDTVPPIGVHMANA